MNKFWIINSYGTDFSWVKDYTDNYIVYDKTGLLPETDKIKHLKNVGYNIYDYLYYIVNNYNNLSDVCVFIKANVFKHCKKEKFDKLIQNNFFTGLDSYEHLSNTSAEMIDANGGYNEANNSWFTYCDIEELHAQDNRHIGNYDIFMSKLFSNYDYPGWIRFSPGANYITTKENILYYTEKFYKKLMSYVDYCQLPVEAHAIERALYSIFSNKYIERK